MSKSKLEKRVDWLGTMVVVVIVMVGLLGVFMLVDTLSEKAEQLVGFHAVDLVTDKEMGITVEETGPTEPVADALAIASLKDYAGLEAERIAKMAAALMGMGGDYTARCWSTYDVTSESTKIDYSITWWRTPSGEDKVGITQKFQGQSWGECIQKMLAWKQGGE